MIKKHLQLFLILELFSLVVVNQLLIFQASRDVIPMVYLTTENTEIHHLAQLQMGLYHRNPRHLAHYLRCALRLCRTCKFVFPLR